MYACGQGHPNVPCAQPDGTEIGACYEAVKLNNVKFVKVTGSQSPNCNGCCKYVVATGEDQTGSIEAWRDDYLLWCSEIENDVCLLGNRSVEGYLFGPLSGDAGTWNLDTLDGYLQVECCNGLCEDNAFKATLSLSVAGGKTDAAEIIDCCTGTTTVSSLVAVVEVDYAWECRHQSRWAGTCPCDLMQEPGDGYFSFTVTQNIGLCDDIDCDGIGQQADYDSLCIVDPPVISYSAVASGDQVECTVGGNGFVQSITGC